MGRRRASRATLLLVALVACCSLGHLQPVAANKIKVEGDWTEVRAGWPLADSGYFVATKKGHHYIEMKNLPGNLEGNLEVELEYYYNYTRSRPVITMVPCRDNLHLHDKGPEDSPNKWLEHKIVVQRDDCLKRNQLSYHVVLLDPGDVFAWRMMSVKSVPQPEPASKPMPGPESNDVPGVDEEKKPDSDSRPADEAKQPAGDSQPADEAKQPDGDSQPNAADEAKKPDSDSEQVTVAEPTKPDNDGQQNPADEAKKPDSNGQGGVVDGPDGQTIADLIDKDAQSIPGEQNLQAGDKSKDADEHKRSKRFAELKEPPSSSVAIDEVCRPKKCDRSKFEMSGFSALAAGVPQLQKGVRLGDTKRYYLNLDNKPLGLRVRSANRRLDEVDACFKFQLYMRMGSKFELLLEEPQGPSAAANETLLEVVRAPARSVYIEEWTKFDRCISDYMPGLGGHANRSTVTSSLKFVLRPKPEAGQSNQMAILIDTTPNEAGYLRARFPVHSHAPDVSLMSKTATVDKYWIFGQRGLSRPPRVEIVAKRAGGERVLQLSDIDATRSTFDITSRWLAIKSVELIENPILFVYRAERADWIDTVEFQFQRAGSQLDDWISFPAFAAAAATTAQLNASAQNNETAQAGKLLELPIRLKGIDASEFRLRLRHHAKVRLARSNTRPEGGNFHQGDKLEASRSLSIRSLAFADICSYKRNYCQNSGQCQPTGPAQAECLCPLGYWGEFCQNKRPCEMLYANRTGFELCASLGALCVPGLPVLRCEWPRDIYFRKLYRITSEGKTVLLESGGASGEEPGDKAEQTAEQTADSDSWTPAEQVTHLKGVVNEQSKLIIILAVFIIAIIVFALVLVGSLVARVRRSSRRLRESQASVQEMVREASSGSGRPGSGGPVASTSFGRAGGAKMAGYTNSAAFDVE